MPKTCRKLDTRIMIQNMFHKHTSCYLLTLKYKVTEYQGANPGMELLLELNFIIFFSLLYYIQRNSGMQCI